MSGNRRPLTPEERIYMLDVARGLSAAEIAKNRSDDLASVKIVLAEAKYVLGARNMSHAVALCVCRGEFGPADGVEDLVTSCTCGSGNPLDYDGPQRDCPEHGEGS